MTAEEIKSSHPLVELLEGRGVALVGQGRQKVTNRCAITEHKKGHLCVSVDCETQLWHCNDCKQGGDVITWLALESGRKPGDVMKELGGNGNGSSPVRGAPASNGSVIETTYKYRNAFGDIVYEVVRMKPKSFRQRHMVNGEWVWNMDGVTRVLYNLPDVIKSDTCWVVEGEKDCDTLQTLGIEATTNVGGAGKWLDAYTESLIGKDVIICGDNDKPGREHIELVFESIAGKVKSSRVINLPEQFKDVTDFVRSFQTEKEAKDALDKLTAEAKQFFKGLKIPVYSMAELETRYRKHVSNFNSDSLDLGRWIPTLGKRVRPLVPGDMVLIVGNTGVGKTNLLINIALSATPMPTVMFEMELPAESMFERFVSLKCKMPGSEVEKTYQSGDALGQKALDVYFPTLFVCDESGLSSDKLERYITESQLKIGEAPRLVLLDYIQLMSGFGKRYEKASDNAESLKIIAKRCGVILVVASQVHRPGKDDDGEIHLHSGKDSGSLENSSGLVIGVWRDTKDKTLMYLKVLKNTKGESWAEPIQCNYTGEMSLITERSKISDDDIPELPRAYND